MSILTPRAAYWCLFYDFIFPAVHFGDGVGREMFYLLLICGLRIWVSSFLELFLLPTVRILVYTVRMMIIWSSLNFLKQKQLILQSSSYLLLLFCNWLFHTNHRFLGDIDKFLFFIYVLYSLHTACGEHEIALCKSY